MDSSATFVALHCCALQLHYNSHGYVQSVLKHDSTLSAHKDCATMCAFSTSGLESNTAQGGLITRKTSPLDGPFHDKFLLLEASVLVLNHRLPKLSVFGLSSKAILSSVWFPL